MPIQQQQALSDFTNQARPGVMTYGKYVWCTFQKAEVLDGVDFGWPIDGVLKNVVESLEMLVKVVCHRLTQRCKEGLPSYIEHIVMPVALSVCLSYQQFWKEQPDKVAARVAL